MPGELADIQQRQISQDREIRRLRLWLQNIAVSAGIRSTKIIGIIGSGNLPAGAAGGLLIYISFGSEPIAGQTFSSTVMYAGDLVVKT